MLIDAAENRGPILFVKMDLLRAMERDAEASDRPQAGAGSINEDAAIVSGFDARSHFWIRRPGNRAAQNRK
jgi:hypothetical protein